MDSINFQFKSVDIVCTTRYFQAIFGGNDPSENQTFTLSFMLFSQTKSNISENFNY